VGGPDETAGAFRTRTLGHRLPLIYFDATHLYPRITTGHVVSMAVVVATSIAADARKILGTYVGGSEDKTFWRGFLTAQSRGAKLALLDVDLEAATNTLRNSATYRRPERFPTRQP
jgi:transposase-like protein